MDSTGLSVHRKEELTVLALLRKLRDKKDVGNMSYEGNISGTVLSLHSNSAKGMKESSLQYCIQTGTGSL